jgi:Cap4 dsDNA endonuclease
MAKASGKAAKTKKAKVSFRDLDPVEQGGRVARDGFDYQDHVATGKCLDMLLGGGPLEIWCEAEDDIVQVWGEDADECFEFVQVKGNELGQAWTVAKLGELEIAKKSLDHDRAREKCRFRLVTRWKPEDTLSCLMAGLGTEARAANGNLIAACGTTVETKLGACMSPNGNGLAFWTEMTTWEVRATTQDVRNDNQLKLERVLEFDGLTLDSGLRDRLYSRLFLRVQDASLACGRTQKNIKRLKRVELLTWLKAQADDVLHPKPVGTSAALERKMTAAQVPATSIEAAKEQRRRYLQEVRNPRFLSLESRDEIEDQALAQLHRLKTQLGTDRD